MYASQNAGCHSFSRQKTLTTDYPKFYVGMPVVRRDGEAVGRSVYGHVIAKFSRIGSLPHFLTHGAPLQYLCVPRLSGLPCNCMTGWHIRINFHFEALRSEFRM